MADGELLSDRLRRGRIPFEQAIAIARQIATALADAHSVSMIHGALEPGNVRLVGERIERIELVDFEITKLASSSTNADRRSDVYALGCVLFEMVRDRLEGEPALRAELPGRFHTMIGAMLAKQPELRPTMADVIQQLDALVVKDHADLHTELERYTETKELKNVIGVIEQIIALESDAIRLAAYYYTAAVISRDELEELEAAIEYFNKALDCYFMNPEALTEAMLPRALRPHEEIDRILTKRGDWKTLERSYRKMIVRTRTLGNHKLQATLFDTLGEIYRSRLKHYSAAVQAFEMAHQLDPESAARSDGSDRAAILAELYPLAGQ